MKKTILTILLLSSNLLALKAQTNLVQNPSFEIYDTCPTSQCQIQNATGWNCYDQCVDYFNACAPTSTTVNVPYSGAGFQYAATGNAYAGEWFYAPNTRVDREVLGTQLLSPLIKGTKYYVTFKVNLAKIDSADDDDAAVNNLGAKFSTVSYSATSPPDTNNYAQVYTDSIVSDTLNWTTISGSFVADSAYKYLMIGNFFDDAHTKKTIYYNTPYYGAYYYIDDVCVSTDSMYCANWTGISEIKPSTPSLVTVYPNPFTTCTDVVLNIPVAKEDIISVMCYDMFGKQWRINSYIASNEPAATDIKIYRGNLPNGMFLLKIQTKNSIFNSKLIINN